MKLLITGVDWPTETFLTNLICGLLDNGLQITIATANKPSESWLSRTDFEWLPTPAWEGGMPLRLIRLGCMAIRFGLRNRDDLILFSRYLPNRISLKKRLRFWNRLLPFARRRWDVIYFPWNSAAIGYLPLFEMGIPVLISCRGSQINIAPHNPMRADIRQGLKETFERATAVHCVSKAIQREAEGLGLKTDHSRVIYPAVAPNFFSPSASRERDQTYGIVTTGTLIWPKGYEYALLAIRQLVDRALPVRFNIIGDGPERQRLLYTVHDLGLQDHVHMHGSLTPEQVRDQLQAADVFLLSSLSEGISNAVLEAMACGLPIVTTDCGGMREAVTHGVEGYVVPTRDPQSMAEALARLWKSPDLRRRMGTASRNRVLAEFDIADQIVRFRDLLLSVRDQGDIV